MRAQVCVSEGQGVGSVLARMLCMDSASLTGRLLCPASAHTGNSCMSRFVSIRQGAVQLRKARAPSAASFKAAERLLDQDVGTLEERKRCVMLLPSKLI